MSIDELWHASDPGAWQQAIERYWQFVQPRNIELEKALDVLDIQRLYNLSPQGWYDFLHDEYFRWKYTAPNRYATTTRQLKRYIDENELDELDHLRKRLIALNLKNVRVGLIVAKEIRGLGTAGASGLLALMYPEHFATVDQFVVKALRDIHDLPQANDLSKMNPLNLTVTDGVTLISILEQKAKENNQLFETSDWTPRKLDKVLWTYGR